MASEIQSPFSVDRASEIPVGVQLRWRLRALVLAGELRPGEELPSVRQLASWAGVNPNTVRAVYDDLGREGLIRSRQGKGTYVDEGVESHPRLESIALEAVGRAREAGVGAGDFAIAVMACTDLLGGDEPGPGGMAGSGPAEGEDIETRLELRRQIGQLEAELAQYVLDLDPEEEPISPPWSSGHVTGLEELEAIRDALFERLFRAQRAAVDRVRHEGEVRARREVRTGPGPLGRAMTRWRKGVGRDGGEEGSGGGGGSGSG
ncbi:MAG TPA: GntR family transcriptional regulator [Solirubrobacterales bacterium]|jgi:GntR family transcriptional regulator